MPRKTWQVFEHSCEAEYLRIAVLHLFLVGKFRVTQLLSPIMKISIITVVRNNVSTLGETFASICEQTHKEIEHIVIDGASTDGTLEVIAQHRRRIAHFLSAADRGPFDAMNKGVPGQ